MPCQPDARNSLLGLPAELRDEILGFVALDDRIAFADHFRRPSLLQVCKQLREEHASVFFADDLVTFDAYYPETASWCAVAGKAAKMDLFERATGWADMIGIVNSAAGAKRYCQKQAELTANSFWKPRHGIMTLSINGAPRYWMYSIRE